MFNEFKTLFLEIKTHVAAGEIEQALRKNAEVNNKLADLYAMFVPSTPTFGAGAKGDDKAAEKAADECIAECSAVSAPPTADAIDPATLLLLIKTGAEAFKAIVAWWRSRKNP